MIRNKFRVSVLINFSIRVRSWVTVRVRFGVEIRVRSRILL